MNMSDKILVVGSKPRFTYKEIGFFSKAYFANAAANRSPFFSAEMKLGVVSSYILSVDKTPLAKLAFDEIVGSDISSFIVAGEGICQDEFLSKTVVSRVSHRTITWQVIKIIGVVSFLKILNTRGGFFRLIVELMKVAVRGYSSQAKPSTGLIAVLLGCREIGDKNRFCCLKVSGIGLDNDGYDYSKVMSARGHLGVDSILIERLQSMGVEFFDV